MAHFICPSCGSEYFLAARTGPKTIFKVATERAVQVIHSPTGALGDGDVDPYHLCCGACSWQGSLGELVESTRD